MRDAVPSRPGCGKMPLWSGTRGVGLREAPPPCRLVARGRLGAGDASPDPAAQQPAPATSRSGVLEAFERHAAAAHAAIAGASDDHLRQPWTLGNGAAVIFTLPRIGALRAFVLNHIIHHRAQLGVYLRLNDVPVPGMYGPSADDKGL